MIDTIALTLTKDMFQISDPEAFTPSAEWATSSKSQRGMQSKHPASVYPCLPTWQTSADCGLRP